MSARPHALLLAALAAGLALALAPVAANSQGAAPAVATGDDGTLDGYDWLDQMSFRGARPNPLLTQGKFKGVDGKKHKHAPLLVGGKNRTKYLGQEFDAACGYGQMFNKSLDRLAKLAHTIARSGRRVVFVVPPNKSSVNKRDLRVKQLPHGRCDLIGLKRQERVLDRYQDGLYLPLRKPLAAASAAGEKHLYWTIDTHWTKIGSVKYGQALANRLDPALARRQTYRLAKEKIQTDISSIGLIPKNTEIGPALFSTTPVRVKTVPGTPEFDPSVVFSPMHAWRTTPGYRAWPGRTLLIGDSFTYRGLDGLMPLFQRGQFLWVGQVTMQTILDAIPQADTVVLQVVQRYLPVNPLTLNSVRLQVRRAIAKHDRSAS